MVDPRIGKLADILIHYSFERVNFREAWEKEKKFLWLRYESPADELAQTITNMVLDEGGYVLAEQTPSWLRRSLLTRAYEDVLRTTPDEYLYKFSRTAARLIIHSSPNTKVLASVKPERRTMENEAYGPLLEKILKTDEKGEFLTPWCLTMSPTNGYAQDMGMSLEECADYIYNAMFLDEKNPVKVWKRIARDQRRMIRKYLRKAKTLEIIDPNNGTKLKMNIEGHRWIPSDGHVNFPSDEIFTAPRKETVNGVLNLGDIPQYDHGSQEVSGIKLRFRDGRLVEYDARVGKDYLEEFLKNEGALYLGEASFGRHPRIDRITQEILLDEKRGGFFHVALGRAYPLHVPGEGDRSGLNESRVHWDLLKDMRDPTAFVLIDDRYKFTWDEETKKWSVLDLHPT